MNAVFKTVLSLSLSGSLLILILFLCKPLLRNRFSRRWQYYVWLIVLVRLLLPFTPEIGPLFRETEPSITRVSSAVSPAPEEIPPPVPAAATDMGNTVPDFLWILWLGTALILLIRKATLYQSFSRYVRAGCEEVSDVRLLDRLAQIGASLGVKRPVELYVNPLVSSPLLLGLFRPCIILPGARLPEDEFDFTVRHELIHCRRLDTLYKWLAQCAVCLHWFNPLVWLMRRELVRACELACDEAVIQGLSSEERRSYGDTLLHAMESGGNCRSVPAAVTLSEDAELLKERLEAIMRFRKISKPALMLSCALACMLTAFATAAGAYFAPAKTAPAAAITGSAVSGSSPAAQAQRFYDAGSLPLFQAVFPRLDESLQKAWLEKLYADEQIAFFSAAAAGLDMDDPLITAAAEKIYADEDIAFFSVLANLMSEKTLASWLDRALEDGRYAFQSVLFNALDQKDEMDALKAELDRQIMAEYEAFGITRKGSNYYYKDNLINIFLDVHSGNRSFLTLNMNPEGTVNIKTIRDGNENITGIVYMTEAEVDEIYRDLYGDTDKDWDDDYDEDWLSGNNSQSNPAGSVVRLSRDEWPDVAAVAGTDIRSWNVIRYAGRQYVWYNGFAWDYAFHPVRTESGWQIDIVKLRKKDAGYVLLSAPDEGELKLSVDGEPVSYTLLDMK